MISLSAERLQGDRPTGPEAADNLMSKSKKTNDDEGGEGGGVGANSDGIEAKKF